MENHTHNTEDSWVGDKLSTLAPPSDWHPDTKRAYARFLNRKDRNSAEGTPRWIQLSMAAAILASIGLVVALLPWQALWRPATSSKTMPSSEIVIATTSGPPVQPQTSAASPAPQQEQKPVEKSGSDVIPRGVIGPSTEPNSTDEARRAHILATVAAVQQTPAPSPPEQEQKPAERVGPGVTPPRAISPKPEPDYTDEARQAHIQGTVVLDVTIRADGTGKVNKVERGLGYGLDEKAIQTFEKWRFEPGTLNGKPVDVQLQVTINFHLY
jgi:TonB family protein